VKYIKTFESFKEKRNEPVNEELFGGVLNFLKNMWNKAVDEIKKLGEKPTMEQLDTWIEENVFNRNSNSYLFKSVMDDFKKKPEATVDECLALVGSIIDPNTGALGKQALSPLYDSLMKVFGKNLGPLNTIKYYFSTARNKAIVDYKYAGGPIADAKTLYPNVDPAKIIKTLENKTHLPDLKLLLTPLAGEGNGAKRKDVTVKWIEGTLLPRLLKYIQDIKKEEVDKYLKIAGVETESTTTKDSIELFWKDIDLEFLPSEDDGSYKITKSNSKKLLIDDIFKTSGEVKKGTTIKLSNITRGNMELPEFIDTPYETGKISKIMLGGIEVESHTFDGEKVDVEKVDKSQTQLDLEEELSKIKDNPETMKEVTDLLRNKNK
jgi:hypothetical protein